MIVHCSTGGYPIAWSVTALYPSAYGVASFAAQGWAEKHKTPQFLVQIDKGEIKRSDLYWGGEDLRDRQSYDRTLHLTSYFEFCALPEEILEIAREELRRHLIAYGFLIPEEEWRRRYPSDVLTKERFQEFNLAYEKAREIGNKLEFNDRWVMFMEPPEGWTPPFALVEQGGSYQISSNREGVQDPTKGETWKDESVAESVCRMLNSGWNYDEVKIHLTPQPLP